MNQPFHSTKRCIVIVNCHLVRLNRGRVIIDDYNRNASSRYSCRAVEASQLPGKRMRPSMERDLKSAAFDPISRAGLKVTDYNTVVLLGKNVFRCSNDEEVAKRSVRLAKTTPMVMGDCFLNPWP